MDWSVNIMDTQLMCNTHFCYFVCIPFLTLFLSPSFTFLLEAVSLSTALPRNEVAKETKNKSLCLIQQGYSCCPCFWEGKPEKWSLRSAKVSDLLQCVLLSASHKQRPQKMRRESRPLLYPCGPVPELQAQMHASVWKFGFVLHRFGHRCSSARCHQDSGDFSKSGGTYWGVFSRNESILENHIGRSWQLLQKDLKYLSCF